MNKCIYAFALLASATLTACGGGGGGNNGSGSSATARSSDATILGFLASSNLDSSSFPWIQVTPSYAYVSKRWTLPIPVKTNGEPRAIPAMDRIEATLGYTVFDRTSIQNLADSAITRGIIVSQGTSYWPSGSPATSYCANVSGYNTGFNGSYPSTFLNAPGEISARLYVNLDNAQCTAVPDEVIHEFGHALGLGAHFVGFGANNSAAISADFWDVLATLYNYPAGTPKANIVAKRL